MTELNEELHFTRVLAVRFVAQRLGIITSEKSVSELLYSGLSLDATLHRLMNEQNVFARLLGRLWMKVRFVR
jgi:hypothetical protein